MAEASTLLVESGPDLNLPQSLNMESVEYLGPGG